MTTQPGQESGGPSHPGQPEEFERVKLTGEQARLVRFILILVAATLLFSALAFLVILT